MAFQVTQKWMEGIIIYWTRQCAFTQTNASQCWHCRRLPWLPAGITTVEPLPCSLPAFSTLAIRKSNIYSSLSLSGTLASARGTQAFLQRCTFALFLWNSLFRVATCQLAMQTFLHTLSQWMRFAPCLPFVFLLNFNKISPAQKD